MEFVNLKDNRKYLKEYIYLCSKEWGKPKTSEELSNYIDKKMNKILSEQNDKLILAIGLICNNTMVGFISLFKYDGEERKDLSPWYATMYVKEEYRKRGYSRILNDEILRQAKLFGYKKVYLKSYLDNYYEKLGAKKLSKLSNGESLYYIDLY